MSNYPRLLGYTLTGLAAIALSTFASGLFPSGLTNISAQERSRVRDAAPSAVGMCDVTTAALPIEIEASAGVMGPVAYANLQAAFAAINAGTHQGAINVEVCFNSPEPAGSSVLNSGVGAAPANYTSVSIRPLADGLTISGDSGSGRGLIELNGADNVTIDGDNPNSAGINRNLRLQNTTANTVSSTAVVRIAINTSTVNSADNNTFRNLDISGSATARNDPAQSSASGPANTTFGIFASGGASGATTAPSAFSISTTINGGSAANLTVQNNNMSTCARAVAAQGIGSSVFNGLLIENNTIGNPTAGDPDGVYAVGVVIGGFSAATVRGNTIYIEGHAIASIRGIDVNGFNINFGSGAIIEKNRVLRVYSNRTNNSAYGILLAGGDGPHVVRNNFVANINASLASPGISITQGIHGIRIANSTGHQVYNNSVNLYGAVIATTGGVSTSSALTLTGCCASSVDIRNNILVNTMTGVPAGSPVVSIFLPSLGGGANLTVNDNDYFSNNQLGQVGSATLSGYTIADFDSSTTAGATNWRNYTSTLASVNNDIASIKADPNFTSPTNLAIQNPSPAADAGATIASVVDDIEGQIRPVGMAYDIGADERVIPSAAGATLAGRVVTANGNGLRGAIVMLTDNQGVRRTAVTSAFGYYRFEDVPTGATCIITVASKRFQFSPQVVTVNGDLTELDFIAD